MTEVVLTLPDNIAKEAEENGLFNPTVITAILKDELRRRKANKFFEIADRLASVGGEPMTEEEVMAEVRAVRESRRHR